MKCRSKVITAKQFLIDKGLSEIHAVSWNANIFIQNFTLANLEYVEDT